MSFRKCLFIILCFTLVNCGQDLATAIMTPATETQDSQLQDSDSSSKESDNTIPNSNALPNLNPTSNTNHLSPAGPGGITTIDLPEITGPGSITTIDLPEATPSVSPLYLDLNDAKMILKTAGSEQNFYKLVDNKILPALETEKAATLHYYVKNSSDILLALQKPAELASFKKCQLIYYNLKQKNFNCLFENISFQELPQLDDVGNLYFLKQETAKQTLFYLNLRQPQQIKKLFSSFQILQWQAHPRGGVLAITRDHGLSEFKRYFLNETLPLKIRSIEYTANEFLYLDEKRIFYKEKKQLFSKTEKSKFKTGKNKWPLYQYWLIEFDENEKLSTNRALTFLSGKNLEHLNSDSSGSIYFQSEMTIYRLHSDAISWFLTKKMEEPLFDIAEKIITLPKIFSYSVLNERIYISGEGKKTGYLMLEIDTLHDDLTTLLVQSAYPITRFQILKREFFVSGVTEENTGFLGKIVEDKIHLIEEFPGPIESFECL